MCGTVFAFLCKDLKDALHSHSLLFVLLGPVLVVAFFANVLNVEDPVFVKIGVYGNIKSGLLNSLKFNGGCNIVPTSGTWEELKDEVRHQKIDLAINIPVDFDQELQQDSFPVLELCVNESSLAKSLTARELVRTALRQMAGQEIPADIRVTKINPTAGSNGNMAGAFLPIWMVFTCLGALSVTSSTFAEELENKTMSAVLLAPVSWAEILGGKIASGFILASLSTILVAAVSSLIKTAFFPLILLICLGSLIFAIGGVILGALVKSQSACGALNSLIYLALIMPVTMADYNLLLQKIAYLLPTWYLYDGFCKLIFTSATWADIGPNIAYLFIELIISAAVAIVAIKKVPLTV